MPQMTLEISGMSCSHCVAAVKQALLTLPDVKVEEVAIGKAIVSYTTGVTSPADITEAIENAGYEAYETP